MAERQAPRNAEADRPGTADCHIPRQNWTCPEWDPLGIFYGPERNTGANAETAQHGSSDSHIPKKTETDAESASQGHPPHNCAKNTGTHAEGASKGHQLYEEPENTGTCEGPAPRGIYYSPVSPGQPKNTRASADSCRPRKTSTHVEPPYYGPKKTGTYAEASSLELPLYYGSEKNWTHANYVRPGHRPFNGLKNTGTHAEDSPLDLTLSYGSEKTWTRAKAVPTGYPPYYGPPPCPNEELWHLQNCLRHYNDVLRYQIDSVVQQIERLKKEKAKVCSQANTEKEEICSLKVLIKANSKAFVKERKTLHKTIRTLESRIADLKHKVRDKECKEECDSSAAQLGGEGSKEMKQNKQILEVPYKTKNGGRICKNYMQKVKLLTEQLSQRDDEILQLREQIESLFDKFAERTEQLQTSEAENKLNNQQWQKKFTCLQEQLRKEVSKKDQIWEARVKLMDEKMKQQVTDKLAEEQREMEKEKIKMLKEMNALEQKNTKLTEENRTLEKDKNKLVEQNENLKAFYIEMQKKMTDDNGHNGYSDKGQTHKQT
ncbi:hypothetical protein Q8A73_020050 [Channa argus]|nr:hypothetical protein Q8A73_020050 [Channa argus]